MADRCHRYREMLLTEDFVYLSTADRAALEDHLSSCASCLELRSALSEDDRRLSALVTARGAVLPELEDKIMQRVKTMDAPPAANAGKRGGILRSNRGRLALAAVLLVCLLFGAEFLNRGPAGGLVWAQVLAQVEEAEDFICRRYEKRSGEAEREILEYRSARYGLRQEIYVDGRLQATQYVNPDEKMLYAMVHRDRTFMQMALTEEQVAEHRKQSNAREIVKGFREEDSRSLGRRKIDGRMAEGIEIENPAEWTRVFESGTWRLWVDLETQWPVLIELEGVAAGGSVRKTYTLKDFQWNAALSARDFAVKIPRGYEKIADLSAVDASEEGAVNGLRAFAKLMDGRYPTQLAIATAIAEAQEKLEGKHGGYDRAAGRDVEALFSVRNACNFFGDLVDGGHDPAYHGDEVGALDFDRVLLRWRQEDGRYRIVFGDLRAVTVDSLELMEMERK